MPQARMLATVLLSALCACNVPAPGDRIESKTETRSVERGKAEMVKVHLAMGAGDLALSGGSAKLLEGRFTYNRQSLKPEIRYTESSFRGELTVSQSSAKTMMGEFENRWDLSLPNDLPIDLDIALGAGESRLKMGDLTLRSMSMKLGAGRVEADFRGQPRKGFSIDLNGGVGEAIVRVPCEVGVIAEAKGGIGDIKVTGMKKDGSFWKNEAYGKSPVALQLNVRGGIGSIEIHCQ